MNYVKPTRMLLPENRKTWELSFNSANRETFAAGVRDWLDENEKKYAFRYLGRPGRGLPPHPDQRRPVPLSGHRQPPRPVEEPAQGQAAADVRGLGRRRSCAARPAATRSTRRDAHPRHRPAEAPPADGPLSRLEARWSSRSARSWCPRASRPRPAGLPRPTLLLRPPGLGYNGPGRRSTPRRKDIGDIMSTLPDLLDEKPRTVPAFDPGFRPMGPAFLKYRKAVEASGKGVPLRIGVEREEGPRFDLRDGGLPSGGCDRRGDRVLRRKDRQVPALVAGRLEGPRPGPEGHRGAHPEDLRA